MVRLLAAAALILASCDARTASEPAAADAETLTVATFNVSLYREEEGALVRELREAPGEQRQALRAIIAEIDPDILVLNEFDHDPEGKALDLFAEELDLGYEHRLALASNTGVRSGFDLDRDGRSDHPQGSREYGNDGFGYGIFPGQYAIAVLSRHPIDEDRLRTYREFLWADLPGNLLPEGFYGEAAGALRLSSKTHAVVPVSVEDEEINLVVAHPTPPGFDGEEDRNGRRNFDEIRLLTAIVGGEDPGWLVDDEGQPGGLSRDDRFIVFGDLNADPSDSDTPEGKDRHAIATLLGHERVLDPRPESRGGPGAAERQGGGNTRQSGDARFDTADFSDRSVGNLRVDYVLPSSDLEVRGAGVFWPDQGEEGYDLVGNGWPMISSDHRLVWVEVAIPAN
jgi:endonuclease/exonuclease/phosphatase family metal-dependent hydrolase